MTKQKKQSTEAAVRDIRRRRLKARRELGPRRGSAQGRECIGGVGGWAATLIP
jgi:hypothetical protein